MISLPADCIRPEVRMSDTRRSTVTAPSIPARALAQAWRTAVVALIGLVIVLGVGFAPLHAIHDAAHDTRHSFNFPCH
jgi:cobalt transporter subunit CbtB